MAATRDQLVEAVFVGYGRVTVYRYAVESTGPDGKVTTTGHIARVGERCLVPPTHKWVGKAFELVDAAAPAKPAAPSEPAKPKSRRKA